jgi:hypothetical protein
VYRIAGEGGLQFPNCSPMLLSKNFSSILGGGDLPLAVRDKLSNPPRAGDGVHRWLFTTALMLHRHRLPGAIEALLAAAVKDCGRQVSAREISDAVKNSATPARGNGGVSVGQGTVPGPAMSAAAPPKWPPPNHTMREGILQASPYTLADLRNQSPVKVAGDDPDVYHFLDLLFPGDDTLLCIGTRSSCFSTFSRLHWRRFNLRENSLIVPSPMTAKFGVTKNGKKSEHTLSNTEPRRYLVTEFDSGTADEQVALIKHLSGFAPLVMVLSSGGKSLHAWWNCVGTSEAKQLKFFRYAVGLGADPATWTRSQFVRLPQGRRENTRALQQVYFFDPSTLPSAKEEGSGA